MPKLKKKSEFQVRIAAKERTRRLRMMRRMNPDYKKALQNTEQPNVIKHTENNEKQDLNPIKQLPIKCDYSLRCRMPVSDENQLFNADQDSSETEEFQCAATNVENAENSAYQIESQIENKQLSQLKQEKDVCATNLANEKNNCGNIAEVAISTVTVASHCIDTERIRMENCSPVSYYQYLREQRELQEYSMHQERSAEQNDKHNLSNASITEINCKNDAVKAGSSNDNIQYRSTNENNTVKSKYHEVEKSNKTKKNQELYTQKIQKKQHAPSAQNDQVRITRSATKNTTSHTNKTKATTPITIVTRKRNNAEITRIENCSPVSYYEYLRQQREQQQFNRYQELPALQNEENNYLNKSIVQNCNTNENLQYLSANNDVSYHSTNEDVQNGLQNNDVPYRLANEVSNIQNHSLNSDVSYRLSNDDIAYSSANEDIENHSTKIDVPLNSKVAQNGLSNVDILQRSANEDLQNRASNIVVSYRSTEDFQYRAANVDILSNHSANEDDQYCTSNDDVQYCSTNYNSSKYLKYFRAENDNQAKDYVDSCIASLRKENNQLAQVNELHRNKNFRNFKFSETASTATATPECFDTDQGKIENYENLQIQCQLQRSNLYTKYKKKFKHGCAICLWNECTAFSSQVPNDIYTPCLQIMSTLEHD